MHAACCSSAVTAAAVLRVSQPLRSRTTPPIFPLRIRVRNRRDGGPTSVPITVSAVSEKPVTVCRALVGLEAAGPGLAAAEATAIVARATRPTNALFIADRVALVFGLHGSARAPD